MDNSRAKRELKWRTKQTYQSLFNEISEWVRKEYMGK